MGFCNLSRVHSWKTLRRGDFSPWSPLAHALSGGGRCGGVLLCRHGNRTSPAGPWLIDHHSRYSSVDMAPSPAQPTRLPDGSHRTLLFVFLLEFSRRERLDRHPRRKCLY